MEDIILHKYCVSMIIGNLFKDVLMYKKQFKVVFNNTPDCRVKCYSEECYQAMDVLSRKIEQFETELTKITNRVKNVKNNDVLEYARRLVDLLLPYTEDITAYTIKMENELEGISNKTFSYDAAIDINWCGAIEEMNIVSNLTYVMRGYEHILKMSYVLLSTYLTTNNLGNTGGEENET